ncbi:MAG: YHS domain-containing protein [Anaerolineales bacterium]|jgi:YHS domain-containing protein|nr:MAG: YHS domain-containing protein [Anaerolineales bacterium]
MVKCPVCGMMVDEATAPSMEHKEKKYFFMNETHKKMFEQDPDRYVRDDESMHGPTMFLNNQSDRKGGCCG